MGKCYEFGVALNESCQHAMTVSPDSGHCGCQTCGTRCEGRFRGCDAVLSQPNRVPPSAPAWAVPVSIGRKPSTSNDFETESRKREDVVGMATNDGLVALVELLREETRRSEQRHDEMLRFMRMPVTQFGTSHASGNHENVQIDTAIKLAQLLADRNDNGQSTDSRLLNTLLEEVSRLRAEVSSLQEQVVKAKSSSKTRAASGKTRVGVDA
jgi:hypothetical protein